MLLDNLKTDRKLWCKGTDLQNLFCVCCLTLCRRLTGSLVFTQTLHCELIYRLTSSRRKMEDNYDREGANKNKLKYVLEKQVVGSSKGAVSQNLATFKKRKLQSSFMA